ncbi:MAG: hypothetical protein ACP5I4_12805 [Oceanipulchritudo sp.]
MILPLFLLLPAAGAPDLQAVVVAGTTTKGMPFEGRITRVAGSVLQMESVISGTAPQIGLPMEGISSLRLVVRQATDRTLLEMLEPFLPVLPLLDGESLDRLVGELEEAAARGEWRFLYQWSGRLLGTLRDPGHASRIALLRAWALLELGLREEAVREAGKLAGKTDPLTAPSSLCHLMARLETDPDIRKFWSLLPSLQIPANPQPTTYDLRP